MSTINNFTKGFAGFIRNNAIVAFVLALFIVGALFYSVPAFAYWLDSSTAMTVTHVAGSPTLTTTLRINKTTDEKYNFSSGGTVTAKLLYQDGTQSSSVTATSCNSAATTDNNGYLFNSYGYAGSFSQYGYGYYFGYGTNVNQIDCTFALTIKNGGVAVGVVDVEVNAFMLGNDRANPGVPFMYFANNQVYTYKQFTANSGAAQTMAYYLANTTNILNITMPANTLVNGSSSGTWNLTMDIILPLGTLGSAYVQSPVFSFGPAGTNFSPNLTISILYGNLNSTAKNKIESLNTAGNLKIMRCLDDGTGCTALVYTIDTTNKVINFSTDHFSDFVVYDGTPAPVNTGGSGSSGGGSIGGSSTLPPTPSTTPTTPATPSSQVPPAPVTPPAPAPTPSVAPAPILPTPSQVNAPSTPSEAAPGPEAAPSVANGNLFSALGPIGAVIAIVLVIVVIGGAAFFLLKGGKKSA